MITRQTLFPGYSDKEIDDWLGNSEHKYYIDGGKQGIWLGISFRMIPWIIVGMLIDKYLM